MKHNLTLTITSLLSILLVTFHFSDDSSGIFFFVWTLIALGVSAAVSVILSARGLWSLEWGKSRSSPS
jgi:hypothetical protein